MPAYSAQISTTHALKLQKQNVWYANTTIRTVWPNDTSFARLAMSSSFLGVADVRPHTNTFVQYTPVYVQNCIAAQPNMKHAPFPFKPQDRMQN